MVNAQFTDYTRSYNLRNIGSNYGVSIVDVDNDGLDEIYVSCRGDERNLFFDSENGIFDLEINELSFSGDSYNSIWFDYDNDGWLDVYVGNSDSMNKLYHNNKDGSFTDVTATSGVGSMRNSLSLMAGDLNNDGWTDLYLANIHEENQLYLNNGDGTFKDFSQESGAIDDQIAMGGMLFDYDNDGDLDIYLTHDARQPNILYQNQGNAVFEDVSEESRANFAGFGMGVDFADFDRDGWLDIYITNLFENALLHNNGDGTFTDIAKEAGVDDYGMGWGINTLDYNNDGWQDIYIVNNSFFSDHTNLLYTNNRNLTFSDDATTTDLESPFAGFGSATTDIDSDGDLDLFVANSGRTGGNQLFINEGEHGNWVKIKMEGTESNRSGIGVRAEIHLEEDIILIDEVSAGTGYASQNSLTLHFGVNETLVIDKVVLRWPSGTVDTYNNIGVNTYYQAKEGNSLTRLNRVTSLENNIGAKEKINVFPNPTNQYLNINLSELTVGSDVTINILDNSGKVLRQLFNNTVNNETYTFDIHDLPSGMFFVEIQSENKTEIQKILKVE